MSNSKIANFIKATDQKLQKSDDSFKKLICESIVKAMQTLFDKDPSFKVQMLKDQPESITKLFT